MNLGTDISWKLGLKNHILTANSAARILVYHGVCKTDPFRFNSLFITVKKFESQLKLYKKYFHLVSLDDFYMQRFSSERFNLCLSFDDGFANNYEYILPLLEHYQVPAVFFVTGIRDAGYDVLWNDVLSIAGRYGPPKIVFRGEEFEKDHTKKYISLKHNKTLNEVLRGTGFEEKAELIAMFADLRIKVDSDYWLQMTSEQIRTLSKNKWVTIGSHGYYHNDLAKVNAATLKKELHLSKNYLQDITGKEIRSVAFPYGSYSQQAVSEAKAEGYSQILATDFHFDEDRQDETMSERLIINPFISNINQIHANLRGNYR